MRLGPARPLCAVGVPRKVESKRWRRVVWGCIFAGAFVLLQSFFFVMMGFGPLLAAGALMLLVATVAMLYTGRGGTRATEQLTFAWAGIGRKEWAKPAAPSELMDWPDEIEVRVVSIGAVWQNFVITSIEPAGQRKEFFRCGFRCERAQVPWVRSAIEALHRGDQPPQEAEILPPSRVR